MGSNPGHGLFTRGLPGRPAPPPPSISGPPAPLREALPADQVLFSRRGEEPAVAPAWADQRRTRQPSQEPVAAVAPAPLWNPASLVSYPSSVVERPPEPSPEREDDITPLRYVFLAGEHFSCASYQQVTHLGARFLPADAAEEELKFLRSARPERFVEAFAGKENVLQEMGFRLDPLKGLVSVHLLGGATCSVEELLVDFLSFLTDCRGGPTSPARIVLVLSNDPEGVTVFLDVLLSHLKHFGLEEVFLEEVRFAVDLHSIARRRDVVEEHLDCGRLSHLYEKVLDSHCPLESGFVPADAVAGLQIVVSRSDKLCGKHLSGERLLSSQARFFSRDLRRRAEAAPEWPNPKLKWMDRCVLVRTWEPHRRHEVRFGKYHGSAPKATFEPRVKVYIDEEGTGEWLGIRNVDSESDQGQDVEGNEVQPDTNEERVEESDGGVDREKREQDRKEKNRKRRKRRKEQQKMKHQKLEEAERSKSKSEMGGENVDLPDEVIEARRAQNEEFLRQERKEANRKRRKKRRELQRKKHKRLESTKRGKSEVAVVSRDASDDETRRVKEWLESSSAAVASGAADVQGTGDKDKEKTVISGDTTTNKAVSNGAGTPEHGVDGKTQRRSPSVEVMDETANDAAYDDLDGARSESGKSVPISLKSGETWASSSTDSSESSSEDDEEQKEKDEEWLGATDKFLEELEDKKRKAQELKKILRRSCENCSEARMLESEGPPEPCMTCPSYSVSMVSFSCQRSHDTV